MQHCRIARWSVGAGHFCITHAVHGGGDIWSTHRHVEVHARAAMPLHGRDACHDSCASESTEEVHKNRSAGGHGDGRYGCSTLTTENNAERSTRSHLGSNCQRLGAAVGASHGVQAAVELGVCHHLWERVCIHCSTGGSKKETGPNDRPAQRSARRGRSYFL